MTIAATTLATRRPKFSEVARSHPGSRGPGSSLPRSHRNVRVLALAAFASTLVSATAGAAEKMSPASSMGTGWLISLLLVTLLPLMALLVTSFVRVSVVLGFVRQALGGGSMIPASVTSALALLLTLFIMAPTLEESARLAGLGPHWQAEVGQVDWAAAQKASAPLRAFLTKHAEPREIASFHELGVRLRTPARAAEVKDDDLLVLVPAFVASELRRAFEMGLLLLLPFLVIDLVVANLLAVSGLQGVSPAAVAVPLKLLLFLLADGWHLLLRGLVAGFV